MKTPQLSLIGGKSAKDWNREWVAVPGGLFQYQTDLNHKVGLFRVLRDGHIMAIGVGTQRKGGMAAKLSAFSRRSDGSRNYYTGRKIREHRDVLRVKVLITGEGELARQIARQLRVPIMELKRPDWSFLHSRHEPRE